MRGFLTVYPTFAELQGPSLLAILPWLICKILSPANTTWSGLASPKQKLASSCLSWGSKHFRTRRAGVKCSHKQHTQGYTSLEKGVNKKILAPPYYLPLVSALNSAKRSVFSPLYVNAQQCSSKSVYKDHLRPFTRINNKKLMRELINFQTLGGLTKGFILSDIIHKIWERLEQQTQSRDRHNDNDDDRYLHSS